MQRIHEIRLAIATIVRQDAFVAQINTDLAFLTQGFASQ